MPDKTTQKNSSVILEYENPYFFTPKIRQILKHFARSFHQAWTSYFWKVNAADPSTSIQNSLNLWHIFFRLEFGVIRVTESFVLQLTSFLGNRNPSLDFQGKIIKWEFQAFSKLKILKGCAKLENCCVYHNQWLCTLH